MSTTTSTISKRRVLRGSGFLSLGPIAALFLGLITTVLIGFYIPPETLGEYSFVNEFISIFTTIALFGLPGAFVKYIGESLGKKNSQSVSSLIKTQIILATAITIGSVIITVPVNLALLAGYVLLHGVSMVSRNVLLIRI